MKPLLRAENVSLELPLELHRTSDLAHAGSLKAALAGRDRFQRRILSGIDFRAEEGDRIGLLGLNGAGKTTLLRVLNGAFPPTSGRVERRGTTQSLLNPTLGFDDHATVVENVFLRGTAMGLRRRQLKTVLGDILLFAGLTDKASHPLHTLSSGQRMRLGFATSTAVQPDILLMDEWLSTGDAAFLEQAQQRMRSRFHGSRIVVLASHSPALIRIMCTRAIVLHEGRMLHCGPVETAMDAYRSVVSQAGAELRARIASDDPLLFGDSVGMVERLRIGAESIEVEGWAVVGEGRESGMLCVEIAGRRHHLESFERVERQDVLLHLGRRTGRYGFRAVVPCAVAAHVDPRVVAVSAGCTRERLGAPLPFATRGIVETAS